MPSHEKCNPNICILKGYDGMQAKAFINYTNQFRHHKFISFATRGNNTFDLLHSNNDQLIHSIRVKGFCTIRPQLGVCEVQYLGNKVKRKLSE